MGRGAQVEFLPPYSPDLNSIEKCWALVKAALRSAKARDWKALLKALRSITPEHAAAWFAHCGHALA